MKSHPGLASLAWVSALRQTLKMVLVVDGDFVFRLRATFRSGTLPKYSAQVRVFCRFVSALEMLIFLLIPTGAPYPGEKGALEERLRCRKPGRPSAWPM